MRLTILGGGGFRVPQVYDAIARAQERIGVTEVVLQDVSQPRLETIAAVLAEMSSSGAVAPTVQTTTDLDTAITGADVIFSAIRVGGTAGRVRDERVAIDLGLLGQETVGPGGLAFALRTVPVADQVAARIAALAPAAWTINFTNPAGIITEAMRSQLGSRVFGICDTPIGLVRRVARALGVDATSAEIDYVGLNHLGWLRGFRVDGVDLLPGLLADEVRLNELEEVRYLGVELVRRIGAIPNEYVYYYERGGASNGTDAPTRGEYLADQQRAFYSAGPAAGALARWRTAIAQREATYMAEAREGERHPADATEGGYHEVAVDLMAALTAGVPAQMILNVANVGTLPDLPDDAVIEIPCRVDQAGAHPQRLHTALGAAQRDLLTAVKASERAVIEAARTGSRSVAEHAFAIHPLVNSEQLGRRLVAGYAAAHSQIGELLGQR